MDFPNFNLEFIICEDEKKRMYIYVLTIHTTSGSASLHVSKFTSKSSSLSRLLVYMWGTQPQGLDVISPIDYCESYVNE